MTESPAGAVPPAGVAPLAGVAPPAEVAPLAGVAPLTLMSESDQSTAAFGEALGRNLTGGEVIGLIGPLGVGKTVFVQGMARGLGITDRYLTSPTFTLMQVYSGRLMLYHIDLYRIEGEIEATGLVEFMNTIGVAKGGVAAIEWADKGEALLPQDWLKVTLSYAPGEQREVQLTPRSVRFKALLNQMRLP